MDDLQWALETKELVSRLNCHLDEPLFENLLKLYLIEENIDDKISIKKDIESVLGLSAPLLLFSKKPMLSAPQRELIEGEIRIGQVMQGDKVGYDFGLSKEELTQHMLITARSGSGKTTLIMNIMDQLMAKGVPFIIFDFKRDYRHLIRQYPKLVVISWKDLRISLLEPPPKVDFRDWKMQFVSIYGHVEGIWQGSTQALLEAIDVAYEETNGQPTLQDVYDRVKGSNQSTRKFQDYTSTVLNRLYGVLSNLGSTVNNRRTLIDMEKLLQMPVVFELNGLNRESSQLLVLWLFYWIYAYRIAQGVRGRLLHTLIIDEAKRVFTGSESYSQTTSEFSGVPPADLICDEIRDFGEAILAADQEPSKLSDSLKANTYTKITSCLGNGKDLSNISEAMNLSEHDIEAVTNLERGEWLVKLAGRYTKPFIIKSANMAVTKDVTDEELFVKMGLVLLELIQKENAPIEEAKSLPLPEVTEQAISLLIDVNYHPFKGTAARYKSLGMSTRAADAAKTELLQKGIVEEVSIKLSVRRPTKFLVPTNTGLALLEELGHSTELWEKTGRQGFEHQLFIVLITYAYRKAGIQALMEKTIQDRRVDILVASQTHQIAIEVELGPFSFEEEAKILPFVNQLIVLVKDENLAKAASDLGRVSAHIRKSISVLSVTDFLHDLSANYMEESDGNSPVRRNNSASFPFFENKSDLARKQ